MQIYTEADYAPFVDETITDDDIVQGTTISLAWPSLNERYNHVIVKYHNEAENFKEDTVGWPAKTDASYWKGVGGEFYYPSGGAWPADSVVGQFYNNYNVWNSSGGTATMVWRFRPLISGFYTLQFAADDVGAIDIREYVSNAIVYQYSTPTWDNLLTWGVQLYNDRDYYIGINCVNSGGGPRGVAASLTLNGIQEWTTRSANYDSYQLFTQSKAVYDAMLLEDNNVPLETSIFASGVTDFYHAMAKAEEVCRTSRGAITVSLQYVLKGKFLEPGDLIKLESITLGTSDLFYVRVDDVKLAENGTAEIKGTRFEFSQLAWNVGDNEYVKPTSIYDNVVPPVKALYFTATGGIYSNSPGVLYWEPVSVSRLLGYILYMATPFDLDSLGNLIFHEIGRTSESRFPLPPLNARSVVFGIKVYTEGRQSVMTITGSNAIELGTPTNSPLSIAVETNVFKILSNGTPYNATILLTAVIGNGVTGNVIWSAPVGYTGSVPTNINTWLVNVADLTQDAVTFIADLEYNGVAYRDSVTLIKVQDGSNTINAYLTNESHTAPSAYDGTGTNLTGAATSLVIYKGSTVDTSNWSIVTTLSAGITISGANTSSITVTTLTADVATVTFTASQAPYANVIKIFTITKARAGAPGGPGVGGLAVMLSRPTVSLPAYLSGQVYDYTQSGTRITVTEGGLDLNFDGLGNAAGTWRVASTATTNITVGTITENGNYAEVGAHVNVSNGIDTAKIDYTISGKLSNGTAFSTVVSQTFSKSKAGAPAQQTAMVRLYNTWALAEPLPPTNVSTYTWATGANTNYTGANGWTVTIPANNGIPGAKLWVAEKQLMAPATDVSTQIAWSVGVTVYAASGNGVAGYREATAVAYKWDVSTPAISGSGTWTWASNDYLTAVPAGWSKTISAPPSQGYSLYAASVRIADNDIAATTAFSWTSAVIGPIGYAGVDGTDGTSAQAVTISGPQSFLYLTGAATPTVTSITLSAALTAGLSGYDWEYHNGTTWTNLTAPNTNSTYILAYNNTAWVSDVLRVRCQSTGGIFDEITILKLRDGAAGSAGANAISALLTNETHAVPTDSAGNNQVYTNSGTDIRVFDGTTELTYDGVGTAAGRYNVTRAASAGTITPGTISLSGILARCAQHSGMTTDTAAITFTITGKNLANVAFTTLLKVQTLSKAKAGAQGIQGPTGTTGTAGASFRQAYARIASNPTPTSGTVTVTGDALPNANFVGNTPSQSWGAPFAVTWSSNDPNPASTNTLYQSDGIYSPSIGNTVWSTPYISSLKVGSLAAVSVNTGALSVTGQITIGSAGKIVSTDNTGYNTDGVFIGADSGVQKMSLGKGTKKIAYDGTTLAIDGGALKVNSIESNRLAIGLTDGPVSQLRNSDFGDSTGLDSTSDPAQVGRVAPGWGAYYNPVVPASAIWQRNYGNGYVYYVGTGGMMLYHTSTTPGYALGVSQVISVNQLTVYEFHLSGILYRAVGMIYVSFYNSGGAEVGPAAQFSIDASNTSIGDAYTPKIIIWGSHQAPANAVTARVYVIITHNVPASGAYLWFGKVHAAPLPPGGSINNPTPWKSNSHIVEIAGGKITARSVTADKIVTNSLTANEIAATTITTDKLVLNAATQNLTSGYLDTEDSYAITSSWTRNYQNHVITRTTTNSAIRAAASGHISVFRDNGAAIYSYYATLALYSARYYPGGAYAYTSANLQSYTGSTVGLFNTIVLPVSIEFFDTAQPNLYTHYNYLYFYIQVMDINGNLINGIYRTNLRGFMTLQEFKL